MLSVRQSDLNLNKQDTSKHWHNIKQQADSEGLPFSECWNRWARTLVAERDWDFSEAKYKKEADGTWERRAELDFGGVRPISEAKKTGASSVPIHRKDFTGCIFPGRVSFDNTYIQVGFDATDTLFHNGVTFKGCEFQTEANFSTAKIYRSTSFKNTIFHENANFDWLECHADADFNDVEFVKLAGFRVTKFYRRASFINCKFSGIADFSNAEFSEAAGFQSILSERGFYLIETQFKKIPDFRSHRFNHLPYIHDLKISMTEIHEVRKMWDNSVDAQLRLGITKFQALKAMAVLAHDHEKEVEYFAREMECLYYAMKDHGSRCAPIYKVTSFFSRIPFIIYGGLSDYGRSIYKPLFCWLGTIVVAAMPFLFSSASFFLSLLNSLPVIGLWRSEPRQRAINVLFGCDTPPTFLWEFAFIVQNIWSSLLVFLLFLAVRNRFKIK